MPRVARALKLAAAVVAFQGAWFACVLGAAHGRPWAGAAVAAGVAALAIAFSVRPAADALMVAAALLVGLAWDSAMARLGWIAYAEPGPLASVAPGWILALWALFAVTLRDPLRALHRRPLLAALLGAVGGPLSYAAAARLGACRFDGPMAPVALAIGWAVITPLLLTLARRVDRHAGRDSR